MEEKYNESEALLTVKDLKMHFPFAEGGLFSRKKGAIRAVDGISFSVKKGETLGLVGESGCGKSTAARAIAQLYTPTSGSVLFKGMELAGCSHHTLMQARKDMQMVFQDPYASLNPRMTAGNIIAEPMRILTKRGILSYTQKEIDDRVEVLMEKVGLSRFFRNRYPHEFSGGQRQRIGIARALALQPELILADEPVSALDVSIQAQILNLFKDLQDEFGLTYVFIAHDLAVIQYISTRVAVMYLGVIVEIANAEELYSKPLHPYTEALLSAAPIPDPEIERKRKRIILSGDVPSPAEKRTGCYFYDRCPKRMEHCKNTIPQLKDKGNGHQVACFLCE
ncbi:ATP-binding cassette domain-containing protein [Treponema medium]|uniref:Oligopeptide/dipeptide ABC transporter, ATP-binding protein domain n=2 Tax=Treponema medium TaxID=58231 RepID=A0AA87NUN2_TREMD|nr:oligopeptide/dipeptide ABC transporter ATP-binding protein [Treponema medium]EPF29026.1 oligopeptide/dipeptide ABC transporter, ATP-binding protein domain [Treponema medium ATCC 700293]QSH97389.1 ATP-binding cassette domain-containing protein [Treponema medium]BAB62248.1 oligopeptide transporter [Treponema medium]